MKLHGWVVKPNKKESPVAMTELSDIFTWMTENPHWLKKHVWFCLVRRNPISYHLLICSAQNWIKSNHFGCVLYTKDEDNSYIDVRNIESKCARMLFARQWTILFLNPWLYTIALASSLFYSECLTSSQFRILYFFKNLVIPLGLSSAPVAFLIQHVADHHPDEAQEDENGHHGQNCMVWLGRSISRIFTCTCQRIKKD